MSLYHQDRSLIQERALMWGPHWLRSSIASSRYGDHDSLIDWYVLSIDWYVFSINALKPKPEALGLACNQKRVRHHIFTIQTIKWKNTSEKTQTAEGQPDPPPYYNSFAKTQGVDIDYIQKFKGCYSGFSQRASSPEIISFRLDSYTSLKESIDRVSLQVDTETTTL
ncbi:hypothetical protein L2E82_19481 [Cichorium intybus]|uniref:Uncharacterized protein n=1 Tax=Cichorium intybus TaxID=13427 RepID=A0ACB9FCC1_CICIN|nr:hypothetical protein L2E82_19481 [Cichorium intybus]